MLVVEPAMTLAIDELQSATRAIEELAIDTNKSEGLQIAAPHVADEERAARKPAAQRYEAAVRDLEAAARLELGAEAPE